MFSRMEGFSLLNVEARLQAAILYRIPIIKRLNKNTMMMDVRQWNENIDKTNVSRFCWIMYRIMNCDSCSYGIKRAISCRKNTAFVKVFLYIVDKTTKPVIYTFPCRFQQTYFNIVRDDLYIYIYQYIYIGGQLAYLSQIFCKYCGTWWYVIICYVIDYDSRL